MSDFIKKSLLVGHFKKMSLKLQDGKQIPIQIMFFCEKRQKKSFENARQASLKTKVTSWSQNFFKKHCIFANLSWIFWIFSRIFPGLHLLQLFSLEKILCLTRSPERNNKLKRKSMRLTLFVAQQNILCQQRYYTWTPSPPVARREQQRQAPPPMWAIFLQTSHILSTQFCEPRHVIYV